MEASGYQTPKGSLKRLKKNSLNIRNKSPIEMKRKLSFLPVKFNLFKNNDSGTNVYANSKKQIKNIFPEKTIPEDPENNISKIKSNILGESDKNKNINEIQNNYFINLTKNIYTDESHLNKNITRNYQNFENTPKSKFAIDKTKIRNFSSTNNRMKNRRMSCQNSFSSYFNPANIINNKNGEKGIITIIPNFKDSKRQKNDDKINSLLYNKNLNEKEKEFMLNYLNNKEREFESTPKYKLKEGGLRSPGKRKKKKKNNVKFNDKNEHPQKCKEEKEKKEELEKEITAKDLTEKNKNNSIILYNTIHKRLKMICLKPFSCCLKTD